MNLIAQHFKVSEKLWVKQLSVNSRSTITFQYVGRYRTIASYQTILSLTSRIQISPLSEEYDPKAL